MSIAITCSCGASLRAKPEHAGKRLKCPKCGQPVSVPAPVEQQAARQKPSSAGAPPMQREAAPGQTSGSPQRIFIFGPNRDAVGALREFVERIREMDFESNPFRDPACEFKIAVDRVSEGSEALRYLSGSLIGRPSVSLKFSLAKDGQIVMQKIYTASVFFQDRRDGGFRGAAFGGSSTSFIRTNCRKLLTEIINDLVAELELTAEDRNLLLAANKNKMGTLATLGWVGITAVILGVVVASFCFFVAGPKDRVAAAIGGFVGGTLVGSLVGLGIARVVELFKK